MTEMDARVGRVLKELEEDGLVDETIIFYYGDHGAGLARSKRFPYNSGLQVPLLIAVPTKYQNLVPPEWQAGGASERLVGFVDLPATVLSLAGIKPLAHLQGHAFLGPDRARGPDYLYGFRGRMDERYDMMRSARDERYVYLRNYMPHRIYGQHVEYLFQTPSTQVWHGLYEEGRLEPPQTFFWETKPYEELYDLELDPDEATNLAASDEHQETLARFRQAVDDHILSTRDTGFLPENEIHSRSNGRAPGDMAKDNNTYPLERIKTTAELAASLVADATPQLVESLTDEDSAVRYWAALGLLMRGRQAVDSSRLALRKLLQDPEPASRIVAAEALGRFGSEADVHSSLDVLLPLADAERSGAYVAMMAMNALGLYGRPSASSQGRHCRTTRRGS